jgi:hypothetical protein
LHKNNVQGHAMTKGRLDDLLRKGSLETLVEKGNFHRKAKNKTLGAMLATVQGPTLATFLRRDAPDKSQPTDPTAKKPASSLTSLKPSLARAQTSFAGAKASLSTKAGSLTRANTSYEKL